MDHKVTSASREAIGPSQLISEPDSKNQIQEIDLGKNETMGHYQPTLSSLPKRKKASKDNQSLHQVTRAATEAAGSKSSAKPAQSAILIGLDDYPDHLQDLNQNSDQKQDSKSNPIQNPIRKQDKHLYKHPLNAEIYFKKEILAAKRDLKRTIKLYSEAQHKADKMKKFQANNTLPKSLQIKIKTFLPPSQRDATEAIKRIIKETERSIFEAILQARINEAAQRKEEIAATIQKHLTLCSELMPSINNNEWREEIQDKLLNQIKDTLERFEELLLFQLELSHKRLTLTSINKQKQDEIAYETLLENQETALGPSINDIQVQMKKMQDTIHGLQEQLLSFQNFSQGPGKAPPRGHQTYIQGTIPSQHRRSHKSFRGKLRANTKTKTKTNAFKQNLSNTSDSESDLDLMDTETETNAETEAITEVTTTAAATTAIRNEEESKAEETTTKNNNNTEMMESPRLSRKPKPLQPLSSPTASTLLPISPTLRFQPHLHQRRPPQQRRRRNQYQYQYQWQQLQQQQQQQLQLQRLQQNQQRLLRQQNQLLLQQQQQSPHIPPARPRFTPPPPPPHRRSTTPNQNQNQRRKRNNYLQAEIDPSLANLQSSTRRITRSQTRLQDTHRIHNI